jgi:N utilization substance protein B
VKPFQARSRARAWALHLLYAWEISDRDSLTQFAEAALRYRRVSPRYRAYLDVLLARLDEHLAEIDGLLQGHIPNWRLERLAAIDRNILRLGVVELRYVDEVPGKVAITEAIGLAERYGSDDSGAFVNGVLDSVYREAAIAG